MDSFQDDPHVEILRLQALLRQVRAGMSDLADSQHAPISRRRPVDLTGAAQRDDEISEKDRLLAQRKALLLQVGSRVLCGACGVCGP